MKEDRKKEKFPGEEPNEPECEENKVDGQPEAPENWDIPHGEKKTSWKNCSKRPMSGCIGRKNNTTARKRTHTPEKHSALSEKTGRTYEILLVYRFKKVNYFHAN